MNIRQIVMGPHAALKCHPMAITAMTGVGGQPSDMDACRGSSSRGSLRLALHDVNYIKRRGSRVGQGLKIRQGSPKIGSKIFGAPPRKFKLSWQFLPGSPRLFSGFFGAANLFLTCQQSPRF